VARHQPESEPGISRNDGLPSPEYAGRYVEIPWQAIEEVDPMSLLGLPLLRVRYSGASRPAFMPLWLSDIDSLRAAVNAHAGERSVLGLWLMQHPRAGQFRF
jgi:hypothetical protein